MTSEERSQKRAKRGVPPDSGKFETTQTRAVRDNAAVRLQKKQERFRAVPLDGPQAAPKPVPKRRPRPAPSWAGVDRPGGKTPAGDGAAPQEKVLICLPRREHPRNDVLSRRRFQLCSNPFAYAKHVLELKVNVDRSIMVIGRLHSKRTTTDTGVLFARVLGGAFNHRQVARGRNHSQQTSTRHELPWHCESGGGPWMFSGAGRAPSPVL